MIDPADYPGWKPGPYPTCMKCNAGFREKQPYFFRRPGFKEYMFLCEECWKKVEANPEPLPPARDPKVVCFERGHHEAVEFHMGIPTCRAICSCGCSRVWAALDRDAALITLKDLETWPLDAV